MQPFFVWYLMPSPILLILVMKLYHQMQPRTIIRITNCLLLFLLVFIVDAQTCIQKLDSANYFKFQNQEKALFYASSLLADLDSAQCVMEIGLAATYNNVGKIYLACTTTFPLFIRR